MPQANRAPVSSRALLLVLGVLLAVGAYATSTLPTETKHALHTQGALHPWIHVTVFAVLAVLFLKATRSLPLKVLLALGLFMFGYATEARESKKDGWPIEQRDVHTDTAGVLLGSALSFLRPPRSKSS
jgi:hypothetical protein